MAYVPRIEVPHGFYHLVTRGNNKRSIYADDHDRQLFLRLLGRVARRHRWLLYAFCLMGNHYHFVLQIAESGLSRGMCELNTAYAANYNARHGRINHLFGRRFWSELITTDAHLLQACRYVVQNPIRAGLCRACEDWPWSSYRATVGLAEPQPFLAVAEVLGFVAPGGSNRVERFRDYCGIIAPRRPNRLRQVSVYSGPEPPSGGVKRPPLAVIAPHWTQFDAVTSTPPSTAS
jgi:putative transposase